MDSCSGRYSAALITPLAQPTVVTLDIADSSDLSARLGQAFTSGMQQAGVATAGTPTVRLTLTYQIVGQGGSTGDGGGLSSGGGPQTGWSNWSSDDEAALQGGMALALPDIPKFDTFAPQQPAQSALLMLRAEARNVGAAAPNWVATVQCTLQGSDNNLLAYQLGYLLGGAIGKRLRSAPI
jgi:hypothetical protein